MKLYSKLARRSFNPGGKHNNTNNAKHDLCGNYNILVNIKNNKYSNSISKYIFVYIIILGNLGLLT